MTKYIWNWISFIIKFDILKGESRGIYLWTVSILIFLWVMLNIAYIPTIAFWMFDYVWIIRATIAAIIVLQITSYFLITHEIGLGDGRERIHRAWSSLLATASMVYMALDKSLLEYIPIEHRPVLVVLAPILVVLPCQLPFLIRGLTFSKLEK